VPSRKRSKGKERKAKQIKASLAREYKTWMEWVQWSQKNHKIQCNHGKDINITSTSACVYPFIESFLTSNERDVLICLESLERTQPLVWKDTSYQKELINILTVMAANQLLFDDQFGDTPNKSFTHWGLRLTTAILVLENYNGGISTTIYKQNVAEMYSRLNPLGGRNNNRDLLKFISKRLSCSCLRNLNKIARKTLPKLGVCSGCLQVKERSTLRMCARCRCPHYLYCSKTCQATAWSKNHKVQCEEALMHRSISIGM